MTLEDFLSGLSQIFLLIVTGSTLLNWARYRDQTRRDIALTFVTLTATIILDDIQGLIGVDLPWLSKLGTLAVASHPYFLLRLAQYFRPVRKAVQRAALVGLFISWVALLLSGEPASLAAAAFVFGYFATVEVYASYILVKGALTIPGITGKRLRLVSVGSGLLGLLFIVAIVLLIFIQFGVASPTIASDFTSVLQIFLILSGLAYYVGFSPPRWLRRFWQLSELHHFLDQTSKRLANDRIIIFNELSTAALRTVGGATAVIAACDADDGAHLRIELAGEPPLQADQLGTGTDAIGKAWQDQKARIAQIPKDVGPDINRWAAKFNARALLIVPIKGASQHWGLLIVLLRYDPLFPQDDLDLLVLLAEQSAIQLDHDVLITELQIVNQSLEQRQIALSEANTLLQTLMDNMPDHIYFKDADSRFIRNSKSQSKMMGLSDPAAVVGKTDFDFFPKDHAQRSYDGEQKLIKSGDSLLNIEERVIWPDGEVTWVSTTKLPLRDKKNKVIGTFGISRDITERKQAEEELQKSNTQLEAANKELEAFSYSVSHDLRAPLRAIDGFSQAVLEDYGETLPDQGRDYLTRVRIAAQRMANLIDDLLNLSRVTRAPLRSELIDLSKLAADIYAELQRSHPERNVRFIIAKNLKAKGDSQLMRAVLDNFIDNAWKFTSKRTEAEIEIGSKHENGESIFFIRDNGAGFDMAYTDKLFGAFQRLHSTAEFPGTGIGLATVQRIIHRHGGRVWAESVLGEGTIFYFTLG